MDLDALVERVPPGWTRVGYAGRDWALTRADHPRSRSTSLYAEELGGRGVVSANVYRTVSGTLLKPCEIPAELVLDFLEGWRADPSREDPGPDGTPTSSEQGGR